MRAAIYESFGGAITIVDVAPPAVAAGELVVEVLAVGLCRSDYHGWHGTDADIVCPHVGGHEFVGRIVAVGAGVTGFEPDQRVVAPFSCGCGECETCRRGEHQACAIAQQPGFTRWGAFAQFCTVPYAATNAVLVPETMSDEAAALVGCRVSTAYRAVVERGRIAAGEVLCVYGCGGVGLAAVGFGRALGAYVIAIDRSAASLALASEMGADVVLDASTIDDVPHTIHEMSGGAHVSVECLGNAAVASNSIRSLRALGRHVQVGLFPSATDELPIAHVIRHELEILGVHGLSATRFHEVFALITDGGFDVAAMITQRLTLDDVPVALPAMATFQQPGVSVVTKI